MCAARIESSSSDSDPETIWGLGKRKGAQRADSSAKCSRPAAAEGEPPPLKLQLSFTPSLDADHTSQEISEKTVKLHVPLIARIDAAAHKGHLRSTMEDAHFFTQFEGGYLMGIFDGHGENGKIAKRTAEYFQSQFPKRIKEKPGDADMIIKELCQEAHNKVTEKVGGTTALVCFVDTTSNELFVGGCGDSEATVFRKMGDNIECFKIPTKRNWGDKEEMLRVEIALNDPIFYERWSQAPVEKRAFPLMKGVRVSRAIGNIRALHEGRAAIIPVPIIEHFKLYTGDLIVMGCDGLWEAMNPDQLKKDVLKLLWDERHLAETIAKFALQTSTDNVSVICVWVQDALFNPTPPTPPAAQEF